MADPCALSIRDLAVQFRSEQGVVRALDGISFDLRAGRTLGIVGESGCGKSVTARSILRLIDRPGRITDGRILLDPAGARRGDAPAHFARLRPPQMGLALLSIVVLLAKEYRP